MTKYEKMKEIILDHQAIEEEILEVTGMSEGSLKTYAHKMGATKVKGNGHYEINDSSDSPKEKEQIIFWDDENDQDQNPGELFRIVAFKMESLSKTLDKLAKIWGK